jgi:hypothetical protein
MAAQKMKTMEDVDLYGRNHIDYGPDNELSLKSPTNQRTRKTEIISVENAVHTNYAE